MALFSDVDWIIIAVVAAFLLFGKENGEMLRTVGRLYGRAMHLKQELLGEITKVADLPPPPPGQAISIRAALLGLDAPASGVSGIPTAVRVPPAAVPSPASEPSLPWTGGYPIPTWSTTVPLGPHGGEGGR